VGGRGVSASRRSTQTARPSSPSYEFLVVTHPFHPLTGQQLPILYERRLASGRRYVCEGGPLGTVTVPAEYTNLGPEPAERPLIYELVVELAALVAAIQRKAP